MCSEIAEVGSEVGAIDLAFKVKIDQIPAELSACVLSCLVHIQIKYLGRRPCTGYSDVHMDNALDRGSSLVNRARIRKLAC